MSWTRCLLTTTTILAVFVSTAQSTECNYALELLALQDASDSFNHFIDQWKGTAAGLHEALLQHFGTFKMGLSAFTDKPIPFRGYGNYGDYQQYNSDYCYESKVALDNNSERFVAGLNDLMLSAGGDVPEDQFEAMIFAALDKKAGWSEPEVTHSEDGRPIVRIMMLITDAKAHEPADASLGIGKWNAPREYPNGFSAPSTGGFGSHAFYNEYAVNSFNSANAPLYTELADLFAIKDAHAAGKGPALTTEQESRLAELSKKFGPEVYPALAYPQHPGDNSVLDCTKSEYPAFDQVTATLKSRGIFPIFILTDPNAESFYEWYASRMNMTYAIATMEDEDLTSLIIKTISSIVDKICIAPSTTTPSPLTTENGSGEHISESDVIGEETSTDNIIVIPPPAGGAEAGGNTGTIAGATAGAVAGLAALGAVAWKTMGFGVLGGNSATAGGVDQVEATNDEVEREAMEEVTMDMFN